MSTQKRARTIPASGQIKIGPYNFFLLINADAPVTLEFFKNGTSYINEDVTTFKKKSVQLWEEMSITGPAGTDIVFFIGKEDISQDDTDIPLAITSVSGTVKTAEDYPLSLLALADSTVAAGSALSVANAGPTRVRVTFANLDTNADAFRIQHAGGGNGKGTPVVPGMSVVVELGAGASVNAYVASTASASVVISQVQEFLPS